MKRIFALILAISLLLCACGESAETSESTTTAPTEVTTEPSTEPATEPTTESTEPEPVDTNPLTGEPLDEVSNARPVAIMINNTSKAAPQAGLSGADIIYEILAEGSVTRFMAIYTDLSDVDVIGPVRSVRPYFFRIAQSYDAILVSAGGSDEAISLISNSGYNYLNAIAGAGSYFYRDSWRRENRGYEHSLMTTGEKMVKAASKYRTTEKDGMDYDLTFDDSVILTGDAAAKITVRFYSKSTRMTYDAATGLYAMYQHGADAYDTNNDQPIAFRNVLILEGSTKVTDSKGHLSVKNTGSGDGYYARDGVIIPIRWSRADNSDQYSYTDLDGNPLVLGVGKSYIAIVPDLDEVDYAG